MHSNNISNVSLYQKQLLSSAQRTEIINVVVNLYRYGRQVELVLSAYVLTSMYRRYKKIFTQALTPKSIIFYTVINRN